MKLSLSDRYLLANVVYQGARRWARYRKSLAIGDAATHGIYPDLTFLLDLSCEAAARSRIARKIVWKAKVTSSTKKSELVFGRGAPQSRSNRRGRCGARRKRDSKRYPRSCRTSIFENELILCGEPSLDMTLLSSNSSEPSRADDSPARSSLWSRWDWQAHSPCSLPKVYSAKTAADSFDACDQCDSCKQFRAGTHPDIHLVSLPKDKSEIPLDLLIGDKEHRMRAGLCYEISLKPLHGWAKNCHHQRCRLLQ